MSTKPKKKYYVVWRGHQPGIYETWDDCKKQVTGVMGAQYKSFTTMDEARQAYANPYEAIKGAKGKKDLNALTSDDKPILQSISVDAACAGNPGILEFRGVFTETETPLFARGPYDMGTVNIGEFLALVLALAYCKKHKLKYPIYSDSLTAISWVRRKQVNTKLERTPKNEQLFVMLQNAQAWLRQNSFETPILKWKTELWGEIPADYGRK
ncbi:MAG: ribonuclease H family protein [Bacteroidales bacterium]|jgi:ribonuclease HI|nr:ribonuclease H family protein [Bacteroidales bacterium]